MKTHETAHEHAQAGPNALIYNGFRGIIASVPNGDKSRPGPAGTTTYATIAGAKNF